MKTFVLFVSLMTVSILANAYGGPSTYICADGWLKDAKTGGTIAYIGSQNDCLGSYYRDKYCSGGWEYNHDGQNLGYFGSQSDCVKVIRQSNNYYTCSDGWLRDAKTGSAIAYLGSQDDCLGSFYRDKYCSSGWEYNHDAQNLGYLGSQSECVNTIRKSNSTFTCGDGWLKNAATGSTIAYIGSQDDCLDSFTRDKYCSDGWAHNSDGQTLDYYGSQKDCIDTIKQRPQ